ncbi:MAG: BrnT family toxin [Chloroflexi bacterium]|nr:BrnT family toxin [Chloroflexota bacterium]
MLVIHRLIWDPCNVAHIARHGVTPEEVEEVCHGEPVVQVGKKGRSLVFGPTLSGRILTVVLDAESSPGGVYYPVTARPSSRRERAIYANERGGETE